MLEIGIKINKLTFLEEVTPRYTKANKKVSIGLFKCDCGKLKSIVISSVKRGKTKSCGCLQGQLKHGKYRTKEYNTWNSMIQRCTNPNHRHFNHYGGRGIKVCHRWLESFENFYEDMGECVDSSLTLDRVDVDGDYTKENCRWVNWSVQNRNKRLSKQSLSGKCGVMWCKRHSKWQVQITVNKKQIWLGYFENLDEAVAAREKVEAEYF